MWIEHGAEELATRRTLPPGGGGPPSISQGDNGPLILWRCHDAQRSCNAPCRVQSVFLLLLVNLYRFAYSVKSEASESVL